MNRALLEQPFSPEQIKQREGHFGKMLDYIEGHAVIQRLNDAFDGDWSFVIIRHEILKDNDEVIVLAELKAGTVVKTQFGSSRITRARESGEIISLADDLKAAATDALKKSATLMGVGLHLYRNDQPPKGHRPPDFRNDMPSKGNGGNGHGNNRTGRTTGDGYNQQGANRYKQDNQSNGYRSNGGNGNGQGNGGGRLTSNQYKYMIKLNEEQGRTKADLDKQCLEMFGTVAQYLSKNDASAVIQQLLSA